MKGRTPTMTLVQKPPPKLTSALEKAAEFHGHLGPFLVIGVRMGLIGLERVGKIGRDSLAVTASVPLRVPFSCTIDGLQVSTSCTVGNQKLALRDSPAIQARFITDDNGPEIIVALSKAMLEKLRSQLLQKGLSDDEIHRLAWKIASIPEDELFKITTV